MRNVESAPDSRFRRRTSFAAGPGRETFSRTGPRALYANATAKVVRTLVVVTSTRLTISENCIVG
jgi:hypothetical protein